MSRYIPNTLFNVISEHFSEIMLRTGAWLHHLQHSLRFQKYLKVTLYCILESLICHNLCVTLQKALKLRLHTKFINGYYMHISDHYFNYITIETLCVELICITEQIYKWLATDLETPLYSFQLLFGDFGMPSCHVSWLLSVKWVSDASWYEHIQLNSSFTFFFFPFLFILPKFQKRDANHLKYFTLPLHCL